jgi:hypothetical protein
MDQNKNCWRLEKNQSGNPQTTNALCHWEIIIRIVLPNKPLQSLQQLQGLILSH